MPAGRSDFTAPNTHSGGLGGGDPGGLPGGPPLAPLGEGVAQDPAQQEGAAGQSAPEDAQGGQEPPDVRQAPTEGKQEPDVAGPPPPESDGESEPLSEPVTIPRDQQSDRGAADQEEGPGAPSDGLPALGASPSPGPGQEDETPLPDLGKEDPRVQEGGESGDDYSHSSGDGNQDPWARDDPRLSAWVPVWRRLGWDWETNPLPAHGFQAGSPLPDAWKEALARVADDEEWRPTPAHVEDFLSWYAQAEDKDEWTDPRFITPVGVKQEGERVSLNQKWWILLFLDQERAYRVRPAYRPPRRPRSPPGTLFGSRWGGRRDHQMEPQWAGQAPEAPREPTPANGEEEEGPSPWAELS